MGSDEVEASASRTMKSIFEEVFPFYLSIGMTYEQFWEGQPSLVVFYRQADEMSRRRRNQEMWLQGRYIYNAIGSFAEILPAFPKKGAKVQPYIEEPFPITLAEATEREERKQKEKMERIKQRMLSRALELNKGR